MSELEFWKDLGNIFNAVLNYQKKNVEFNNRFINPWIRLGNIFERQDQTNDAVLAYQHATEIDPDTPQNWVDLGDAQFKKGEYDEAIEAYRKAVMLDPEAGWPLGNLALTLVTQGKIEEAIPLYQKSIVLLTELKDKAICWNRLGNAYRKLNDYENAFFAFQTADQLDGENTGFNDTLDETPPSTPVVAPEEILEQMIVEQTLEEVESKSTTSEVVHESAQETVQPEIESAPLDATEVETIHEPVTLEANLELEVESGTEEEAAQPLNEPAMDEDSPLVLHEKNFDIIQVVEDVITKIEKAYADKENSGVEDGQEAEEGSTETEFSAVSEDMPQALPEKGFDIIQAVEDVITKIEQASADQEIPDSDNGQKVEEVSVEADLFDVTEDFAQEAESIAESNEEIVLDVESAIVSEEVIQKVEFVAEANEGTLEIESSLASEEAANDVESMVTEINSSTESEAEASVAAKASEVEQVSENKPSRFPSWLMMKDLMKGKETVAKAEVKEEFEQSESVTTISDISQEAAISESIMNMDVVETYTDASAAQLITESSLGEESTSETTDQAEDDESLTVRPSPTVTKGQNEADSEIEEKVAVGESNQVDESAIVEGEAAELAYEEYLKDVVEPTNIMPNLDDDTQSEAPITKVSKNGEVRIAMDTKNAHVWNELGNIYLNASACDDAIASYSKAIELDRHFAWPYSNIALAYVQKGRFAEAILLYQRGIELFTSDKDKAITWNRLGNVYRRINDYSNAIAAYQTADELDPENATLSLRSSFGLLGNMYSDSKSAYVA